METKIVSEITEKAENEIVYDIDEGLSFIKDFIKRTSSKAKPFYKLSKKMNGKEPEKQKKETFKFCKEELLNQWMFSFGNKFYKNMELNFIEIDDLYTYILGFFILGNSEKKEMKEKRDELICKTIFEMTQRMHENKEANKK